jgi:hypothetical protein
MKEKNKENIKDNNNNNNNLLKENEPQKEIMDSLRNIKLFNEKMFLSTSMKNKEIYLWSENSGTIAFTYLDENLRTYIPYGKIKILDPLLYSEYFIYLHENKSLFNIWKTSDSQFYSKFSCTDDDKISCFCVSKNSQILFVGTVSGYIISYNLAVGKILRNVQIAKNEIIQIEQIENIIIVLTNEKIMIYYFSSFLESDINTNIPKEILSYNFKNNFLDDNNNDSNSNNSIYKNFVIENNQYIYLWNTNNILVLNIDDLKPYKLFHIIGENDEYKKIVLIDKLVTNEGKIYFNNGLKDIFFFDSNEYKSENTFEIKINKNNSVLYLPNTVKFSLGNISIFLLGTKNNIITGHEDGKICFWKKKENNSLFFTYENMSQIHKGKITNILILNKPISQYGLNFNKQISECVVSKVQTKKTEKIKIKQNNNLNSVEYFLDKKIEENMNNILFELMNNNENNKNNIEIEEEKSEENENEKKLKKNKKKKK